MEDIHQERVKKILDLQLSGLMDSSMVVGQAAADDSTQEKEEIIDNVIQEMQDCGDLE